MYVQTCICAGGHSLQFPLVFLWPAAKTYSWRLPKLEPAVEVCVRLHAGTYVRMSMAVGWPKGNSLVYLHKWHTLIMHYLTCSCTQTSFTIFLHFFVRIQVENDTIMYYVCFLYIYTLRYSWCAIWLYTLFPSTCRSSLATDLQRTSF